MGTVEPRKAAARIAQAFGLVKDLYPDWDLVFVGGSDAADFSWAPRVPFPGAGLEDRAKVVPVVGDTYCWYRARISPVLFRSGVVAPLGVEAMCSGLPVSRPWVFGLPELLDDGRTGFLFEPNDLECGGGGAAPRACARPLGAGAVGEAGRRHILERYDSAGYVADFMALFGGFMRDRASTPNEILLRSGRQSWEGKAVGAAG